MICKKTQARKNVKSHTDILNVEYHLKAILPGRAWVESSEGEAETVSVGDSIENYGQVTAIDPDQGIVSTASGKMIRYGERDN